MSINLSRFYEYLRLERHSKRNSIEMLDEGRYRLSRRTAGGPLVDVSAEHAETLRGHVEEIEAILIEAGEPLG